MISGAIRSHAASLKINRSITHKTASQKAVCVLRIRRPRRCCGPGCADLSDILRCGLVEERERNVSVGNFVHIWRDGG